LGSSLPNCADGQLRIGQNLYHFQGMAVPPKSGGREFLVETALMYLHAPYLWGGRSPFGIDCSGFVQVVYKFSGIQLPRDAWQQAEKGDLLSFIEESAPGDLAFFDNDEGTIIHVGILLENNRIIHASGKVRIDVIDHQGIYNRDLRAYTHNLRLIKSIL
jgi:cell wall-associated NlpC family hydrolase